MGVRMDRKPTSTNSRNQLVLGRFCVLNDTLARISLRWKMQILHALREGPVTFSALKTALPEVTDQVLAKRLRELAAERLVATSRTVRRAVSERATGPYALTARGAALLKIMHDLCAWELASDPIDSVRSERAGLHAVTIV
jgi:DNA-binding HxlR family transcriptional regulator